MNVFTVKKYKDDEIANSPKGNVSNIKLNKKEKFNYLIMENPYDSNKICTIKNIIIYDMDNVSSICLMCGEGELFKKKYKIMDFHNAGIFNVETRLTKMENNSTIELIKKDVLKGEKCSILDDTVLLVLPKGYICIKLDNEVSSLSLDIEWTSEEIC